MSKLTIVIPFFCEGDEVEKTLSSVKATAATAPDIILVNDGSTDGYGYRAVSERYGCRYVEHAERMGVAASRDNGVSLAQTPFVLLLDAHMELYGDGWDARVIALLEANPRALLCSQTEPLTDDRQPKLRRDRKMAVGAAIGYDDPRYVLKAKWSYEDANPSGNLSPVGCVLGAAYAMRRDYYELLRGLRGLRSYGLDEELLSLKVQRSGGQCLLVKDWLTGHVYGRNGRRAFSILTRDLIYNQLMVMALLFGEADRAAGLNKLRAAHGSLLDEVISEIGQQAAFVRDEREYLMALFAEVEAAQQRSGAVT